MKQLDGVGWSSQTWSTPNLDVNSLPLQTPPVRVSSPLHIFSKETAYISHTGEIVEIFEYIKSRPEDYRWPTQDHGLPKRYSCGSSLVGLQLKINLHQYPQEFSTTKGVHNFEGDKDPIHSKEKKRACIN